MNQGIIRSKWHEIQGKVTQQWDKITYDDLVQINGSHETLEAILNEKYGYDMEKAQEEIDKFLVKNLWKDK